MFVSQAGRVQERRPLLMGKVSKFARVDRPKLVHASELGKIDSVKKVSILIVAIYLIQPTHWVV
jgi:hypothetical protein